ncbi:MAG: aspartyl protease family protein [Flavobacterium sp.]|uniref:retropepsin-like aspartic protease n=1 Tax=Flavobacterium sp. TaxID=239 RepID=UPI0032672F2F
MKKLYLLTFIFFLFLSSYSQEGFQFTSNTKKIKVPFQLSNNLIIIPVKVNGVNLNFLLDTGVEKTILFSLEETDSLQFNNIEKIKIRGLGSGIPIDALHSKKNKISINGFVDNDHEIYIILDQEINFSSQLGIPVHGIIGYEFFKNHFIEVNYNRKRLNIYRSDQDFSLKKLNRYDEIPISLEIGKPYIETIVNINSKEIKTKLLLDTGGSDALWLFENKKNIQSPKKYFKDFLGRGFSGNVYGKRSRIEELKIGNYKISYPTISFPDTLSLQNVEMVEGRNGSLGGEMLKRFNVIFDYKNKKIHLKKNSDFENPFDYNMSGIEIQHNGLQWIKEEIELKTNLVANEINVLKGEQTNVKYNFLLKPVYEIANVTENSPGEKAGLKKGDIIDKINGNYAFKYKLQQITQLLQSEEGRTIKMEVERKGKIIKTVFQLKKIL